MALAVPKLDDRKFQDIVDEAKKRIPHYCREWTDHNVSDPGVTLIELFAWMTETLLYRLNQVPDLHYIKFMQTLGITLQEPVPAKAPVTFWLSKPLPTSVLIPAGTEVGTTQTEMESSIVFTITEDFQVQPPELAAVVWRAASDKSGKKRYREQNLRRLETGFDGFAVFTPEPQVDDALYFGFENNLSRHILGFQMDFDPAGGAGIDPAMPPYLWEASTGNPDHHWESCDLESDTTHGMNGAGKVQIHLPSMGKYEVDGKSLFWVRVRVKEISPSEARSGMQPYQTSPRLRRASVASWGGTVPAIHARVVTREFLGRSDGSPGQRLRLQYTPILKREPGEALIVQVEGEPSQQWEEARDFAESGSSDHHFILDGTTGELRFGPGVRQPDGTIKLYGAIPPRGANLIFERYRHGGGQEGNVQKNVLNTLKTSIPYIARVANREPAWGGLDSETLEAAMMRAPALLRSRERAVTEDDFEFLARQALPAAIGRVKCLQPQAGERDRVPPGRVYVLVVPRIMHPEGYLDPEQLELKPEEVEILTAYLDERRLLTTRLDIRSPAYQWVSVRVHLRTEPGAEQEQVEAQVLARLYRFLNPLTGGQDGDGWPFGRSLYVSDIYQSLQGTPGVQFLRGLDMYAARPGGEAYGEPIDFMEVLAHGVIASARHQVEFV